MTTTLVAETATPTKENALEALSELVDLLCQTHHHELAITNPIPSESVEGYSVVIECCESGIVWTVQMWANCRFRRLRSSKTVTIQNTDSKKAPKTFLQTLQVWDGLACDDIVKLHRLGQLKKDWWSYPVMMSDEQKDAIDYYNQGPTNGDPENQMRAIEAGYQGPGAHNVTYYPRAPQLSSGLTSAQY
ncbi:hypothetical protein HOY82DRAFT_596220 [Tuber indicum]|nr:hypothetical protein HOY82DRAFT_596220 [Tuber indicum]